MSTTAMKPYKLVIDVTFQTWGEAMDATEELYEAGYDVLIATPHQAHDPESDESTFAEVYANVSPEVWHEYAEHLTTAGRKGDDKRAFAIWDDVERIVAPYDGVADSCGPLEDDHVPFNDCAGDGSLGGKKR